VQQNFWTIFSKLTLKKILLLDNMSIDFHSTCYVMLRYVYEQWIPWCRSECHILTNCHSPDWQWSCVDNYHVDNESDTIQGRSPYHQPDSYERRNQWNDHNSQQLCALPQGLVQLPSDHACSIHMPSYFPSPFVHRCHCDQHTSTLQSDGLQTLSVQLPAKWASSSRRMANS